MKLEEALNLYEKARNVRLQFEDEWDKQYKLYKSYVNKSKYPFKSKLFIPKTFRVIETLAAILSENFLVKKPFIEVLPRFREDLAFSKIYEVLLDYWFDLISFDRIFYKHIKEALIYGTAYTYTYWDNELQSPNIKQVYIKNIYKDVEIYDFEKSRFLIYTDYIPLKQLRKQYPNFRVEDEELIKSFVGDNASGVFLNDKDKIIERMAGAEISLDDLNPMVEVAEVWTQEDITKIANRKFIIEEIKNPYGKIMFQEIKMYNTFGEIYGHSIIKTIYSLQHELNNKKNQRIDNINMILNPILLMNRNSAIDKKDFRTWKPWKIVETNDIKGVEFVRPPDVTATAYNEEKIIKEEIDEITNIGPIMQGIGADHRTARGIYALIENANTNLKPLLREVSFWLCNVAKSFALIGKKNFRKKVAIRIMPEKFDELAVYFDIDRKAVIEFFEADSDVFKREYDYKVKSNIEVVNKMAKAEVITNLLQILLPVVAQNPAMINLPLLNELMSLLDVKKGIDTIAFFEKITQQQQLMALLQQYLQQQQQAQQQQQQAQTTPQERQVNE